MPEHRETVAVIAGGTQGLGLASAGRRKAEGEAAAEVLRQRGAELLFIRADMGRLEDAQALVDRAAERFGRQLGLYLCQALPGDSRVTARGPVDFDQNVSGAYPE